MHGILLFLFLTPHLPTTATIHGELWHVIGVEHLSKDYDGWTECAINTMLVDTSESLSQQAETLTHEILHALTCEDGELNNDFWNNEDDDHDGIYWAAPELAQFIKDNPQIIQFISQAYGPHP